MSGESALDQPSQCLTAGCRGKFHSAAQQLAQFCLWICPTGRLLRRWVSRGARCVPAWWWVPVPRSRPAGSRKAAPEGPGYRPPGILPNPLSSRSPRSFGASGSEAQPQHGRGLVWGPCGGDLSHPRRRGSTTGRDTLPPKKVYIYNIYIIYNTVYIIYLPHGSTHSISTAGFSTRQRQGFTKSAVFTGQC